jgi:Tfp pilus assembly protein PilN
MRPVNLIPPEERRDKAPIRTGPIAYLLVGALVLALGGMTMVVLTNNKISDKKAQLTQLKGQQAAAKAQADQFAPFSSFATVKDQRTATITSLANSRFDWPRVMRELARVIPRDVWLTNLTGKVSSTVNVSSSGSSSSGGGGSIDTTSITGPSLQFTGCAASQDSVARFLAALRDIDGITRVGLSSSDLPSSKSTSSSSGDSAGANTDCAVRDFIAQFEIVAAFDAVPPPQVPGASPTPSTPAPTTGTPAPTTPAAATTGAPPAGN